MRKQIRRAGSSIRRVSTSGDQEVNAVGQNSDEDDGTGEGIYFGGDLSSCHTVDPDGEGHVAGTCHEVTDDHIIDGNCRA